MIPGFFHACLLVDLAERTEKIPGSFLALPTCKGVILFADGADRPIQLLMAANIRRTVRSRLARNTEDIISKRADLTEIVERVYFVPCYNDFLSMLTCYQLAKGIYPETYADVVKLPKQNYVRINLAARWPVFSITEKPACGDACNEKTFGPFPTRKAASELIRVLNDVFELCQKTALVESPEKAKSCPYMQMKTCPAPCVGNISYEQYRGQIDDAVTAAGGDIASQIDKLKMRMKEFAGEMEFEKASRCKNAIEQLNKLSGKNYEWTGLVDDFAVLHIDRSAKIKSKGRKLEQSYCGFLIRPAGIKRFVDFTLDEIETFYTALTVELDKPSTLPQNQMRAETLAITAYFLFRNKPAGLYLNCEESKNTQLQLIKQKLEAIAAKHS
jgi:hypothetical protein